MRPIIIFLALSLIISCSQPSDVTLPPPGAVGDVLTPTLSVDYTLFDGSFIGDVIGLNGIIKNAVRVTFDKNKARATCTTANATVQFLYTFVLDKGTITTYVGEYPIIWWFECKQYPYVWDGDSLIITDPINNRTLILKGE